MHVELPDYPSFYEQAPTITVQDGLAGFLGACRNGLITYRYVDAVKLAGHSCPTVAGTYLLTRRALQLLYPGQTPQRGHVQVRFAAAMDEGATGVMASVVTLITGAAGPGGFQGIGARFRRQNLLSFGAALEADVLFERVDTSASVRLSIHLNRVPADSDATSLLRDLLQGRGGSEDSNAFAAIWQERVRRILIDHADDPELITLTP